MDTKMEGQVAIVTGAAMGIGRAFVELLLARRLRVCIGDVDDQKGQQTTSELKKAFPDSDVIYEHCDVTKQDQLEGLFKKTRDHFGRLDVVVNNAGIMDESRSDLMLRINLLAVIKGTELAMNYMNKNTGGQGGLVINIGSIVGVASSAIVPVYAATKHGVVGYSRSLGAISLATHGVRVNCICPSFTNTTLLTTSQSKHLTGPEEQRQAAIARIHHMDLIDPKTVASCLEPFLVDVTLSGAVILCSHEHPKAILKMPSNVDEIQKTFLPQ